ncbi:MAG: ankyrin repeat domain-containing protein [Opitutaceae bacterium]|nr:ankyrin repeat domain-containing protein [Opitutaceae bacterium]
MIKTRKKAKNKYRETVILSGFFLIASLFIGCGSNITENQKIISPESKLNLASKNFDQVVGLALAGDKQQLRHRLQQGKSIDVVDEQGRSAVLVVTIHNDMNALQLLIELGADVDFYDKALSTKVIDQTAFLYAGAHGMNEALILLIDAGAKPDIYNYYEGTALIPAAEKGHVDTVKLLLEKSKIDIDHVNRPGWTALMEAVISSDGGDVIHQQIIKLLLAHGADSSIADKEGISALEHAQKRGHSAVVELLRQ